jgi:hypothetical protein
VAAIMPLYCTEVGKGAILETSTQSAAVIPDAQIDAWIEGLQQQRKNIEAAQGQWKAFVHWMSAEQIEALRPHAQARINGALKGAAVAVKDIFDTSHLATEYGSPIHKGHRPVMPSAAVQCIERAGGVVLGKSVTTEFAFLEPPATRNPSAPHAWRLVFWLGRSDRCGPSTICNRYTNRRLGDSTCLLLWHRRLQAQLWLNQ